MLTRQVYECSRLGVNYSVQISKQGIPEPIDMMSIILKNNLTPFIMQFITLSIFLIVATIAIATIKPKTKKQVWAFGILLPIVFSFLIGFCVALLSGSKPSLGYQMGSFMGSSVPSVIITSIILCFSFDRKLKSGNEYKFPKLIIIPILVCAIIGGIMLYMKMQTNKLLYHYIEEREENYSMTENRETTNEWVLDETSSNRMNVLEDKKYQNGNNVKAINNEQTILSFLSEIRELDQKCPILLDDNTSYRKAVVMDDVLMIKVLRNDENEIINNEEFVKKLCMGIVYHINKQVMAFMNDNEYFITFMIYNKDNYYEKKIQLVPKAVLEYY